MTEPDEYIRGKDYKWSKFSWEAWVSDPALSCCGPAARGVWMDILAAAHKGDPVGHVTIDGEPPSMKQLAKITRCNPRMLPGLLEELESNGVFSRTPEGVIYSRRMVRDFNAFLVAVANGKKGGNPDIIQRSNPPGGL